MSINIFIYLFRLIFLDNQNQACTHVRVTPTINTNTRVNIYLLYKDVTSVFKERKKERKKAHARCGPRIKNYAYSRSVFATAWSRGPLANIRRVQPASVQCFLRCRSPFRRIPRWNWPFRGRNAREDRIIGRPEALLRGRRRRWRAGTHRGKGRDADGLNRWPWRAESPLRAEWSTFQGPSESRSHGRPNCSPSQTLPIKLARICLHVAPPAPSCRLRLPFSPTD